MVLWMWLGKLFIEITRTPSLDEVDDQRVSYRDMAGSLFVLEVLDGLCWTG